MVLRFIYNRFGEILTLVVSVLIGIYLVNSFSGSAALIASEERAREMVKEIYRLQEKASAEEVKGAYQPLSGILEQSSMLQDLRKRKVEGDSSTELYENGNYYFLSRLEHKTQSAEDYISGHRNQPPIGFKLLAWPRAYSRTGEIAVYVDQRGVLMATANKRAMYNGLKVFPPDLKTPAKAIDGLKPDGEPPEKLKEKNAPPWQKIASL